MEEKNKKIKNHLYISLHLSNEYAQWARKFKKVQAKKLMQSNKSFFYVKLHFRQF